MLSLEVTEEPNKVTNTEEPTKLPRPLLCLQRWQLSRTPYWWLLTLDTSTGGSQSGIVAGAYWDACSGGYRRVNKITNTEESTKLPTQTQSSHLPSLTHLCLHLHLRTMPSLWDRHQPQCTASIPTCQLGTHWPNEPGRKL